MITIGQISMDETPEDIVKRFRVLYDARVFTPEELKLLVYQFRYIKDIVDSRCLDYKTDKKQKGAKVCQAHIT